MRARLPLFTALLGVSACTTADDGTPIPSMDEVPLEAVQTLMDDEGGDGGAQCHGRHYWTIKDNRTPQLPRGDLELIDTLVPHHQMAVEMAKMEVERGSDAEVKAMAEKVIVDQAKEIEELLAIRNELVGCTTVKPFRDAHMERDSKMMMDLSGAQLDLMFVEDMIAHHASALQFTHYALPNLKDPELSAIAKRVIDAQAMEVGELHIVKMRLRATTAGSADAGPTTGAPAPCTSDADCGSAKCITRDAGSFCDVTEMVTH